MAGPYLERMLPYDLAYGYQYNRIVDALTNSRPQNTVAVIQCYDVCFGYQPVDATFKARCRFHVHGSIDTIIQVGLHFSLQPFHVGNQTTSASSTSSGGSAHNHSVSGQTASSGTSGGTSHSHVLNAGTGTIHDAAGFDISGNFITAAVAEGVSVGIEYVGGGTTSGSPPGPTTLGAHTHSVPSTSVTGATSTNESAHTHTIPALTLSSPTAIYEAGMAQGVHVFIDGTDRTSALGGPWGVGVAIDITDLSISQFVNTTGWHEIQLSSTSIGGITTQIRMSTLLNGSI